MYPKKKRFKIRFMLRTYQIRIGNNLRIALTQSDYDLERFLDWIPSQLDTRFCRSQRIFLVFHRTYSTLWSQQVSVKTSQWWILQEPHNTIKNRVGVFLAVWNYLSLQRPVRFSDLWCPYTYGGVINKNQTLDSYFWVWSPPKISHFDLFFFFACWIYFTFEALLKTSSSL